jgi:hypothetical protein
VRCPELTLEKELLDLLGTGRNARIAARSNGFDGRGGESFQSVGNSFGLTRERIRQIVTAASARLRTERPGSPVLDRSIAFVADHIGGVVDAGVIETEMRSAGLTAGLFRLEGVIKAAELLGRRLPFAITHVNGERLVHSRDVPPLDSIVHTAGGVVAHFGIANVSDVAGKLPTGASGVSDPNLIASVLACARGVRWLDRSKGWFWSDSGINPLLRRIRKIVSVANPVSVLELQASIPRDDRMKGFSPPQQVLLEFCHQAPGLHVRDDKIGARPRVNPDEVLSRIEKQMVSILSEHGGPMPVSKFMSICCRGGVNRRTCYLYLVHSPIFSKYGHGFYGLIGSGENLVNRASHRSPRGAAQYSQCEMTSSAVKKIRKTLEAPE